MPTDKYCIDEALKSKRFSLVDIIFGKQNPIVEEKLLHWRYSMNILLVFQHFKYKCNRGAGSSALIDEVTLYSDGSCKTKLQKFIYKWLLPENVKGIENTQNKIHSVQIETRIDSLISKQREIPTFK